MLPSRIADMDGTVIEDSNEVERLTVVIQNDEYPEEELREFYCEGTYASDYEPAYDADGTEIPYEWPEEAPARPLDWANSAAIILDEKDDAIHVNISCGDPRGAFSMTIRRLPDGRLMLYHPYPGEGWAHRETEELQKGALLIK